LLYIRGTPFGVASHVSVAFADVSDVSSGRTPIQTSTIHIHKHKHKHINRGGSRTEPAIILY